MTLFYDYLLPTGWLSPIWLALVILVSVGTLTRYRQPPKHGRLPPSPKGHWFWGNKEQMSMGYRAMVAGTEYRKTLGDIICLKSPFQTKIMLNSADMTNEILEKHAAITGDRPKNTTILEMTKISETAVFRPHDEYHRKLRRVMASALHVTAARAYAAQHYESTTRFLRDISSRRDGFSRSLNDAVGSFIMQMVYDYVILKDDPLTRLLVKNVEFAIESMSKHYWVNDIPLLRHIPAWFPGAGFKRRTLEMLENRTAFADRGYESVLDKVRTDSINHPSYVSRLLELKGGVNASPEDQDLIKWSASTMFGAGTSTTVGVVKIFTLMMALHPEVAQRVQKEIDEKIGRDRIPNFSDRDSLPYLDAALQESLRIAPPLPLGLSHYASEDIEVAGYHIPKGAILEGNIWAILHDPVHYPSPNKFDPSRFLGPLPAPDPRKYIFGFGRRICPGQHVANNSTWIICAGLMALFNVRPTPELDNLAKEVGEETWKLFEPFESMAPLIFDCDVKPRDASAQAVLSGYEAE